MRRIIAVLVFLSIVGTAEASLIELTFEGTGSYLLNAYDTVQGDTIVVHNERYTGFTRFTYLFDWDTPTCGNIGSTTTTSCSHQPSWGSLLIEAGHFNAVYLPTSDSSQRLEIRQDYVFSQSELVASVRGDFLADLGQGLFGVTGEERVFSTIRGFYPEIDPLSLQPFTVSGTGFSYLKFSGSCFTICQSWETEMEVSNTSFSLRTIPEPGTLALFAIGLAGMGLARRKRNLSS